VNEIALPVQQAAELRARLTQVDSALVAKLSGTADLRVTDSVEAILTRVHQKALELAIAEVHMDLRDLEFMNSSCFKSFVSWISEVSDLTAGQYRIRFLSNPSILWQRRSLHALSCFAAAPSSSVAAAGRGAVENRSGTRLYAAHEFPTRNVACGGLCAVGSVRCRLPGARRRQVQPRLRRHAPSHQVQRLCAGRPMA